MNAISSEDIIAELLTLNCETFNDGTKVYRNKEGQVHRIHGPAAVYESGTAYWYKNGNLHRENGPAVMWDTGKKEYFINGYYLTKKQFVQWQIANGITPID